MTMSDEGRKIWNSPAGVHLLKTWGLGNAAADKSGREPDSDK